MKERWGYEIVTADANDRSLVIAGGDSLPDAIRGMIQDYTYYVSMGYKCKIVDLCQWCGDCNGSGYITKKTRRGYSSKPCKPCKGTGKLREFPGECVPEIHRTVSIVDKGA